MTVHIADVDDMEVAARVACDLIFSGIKFSYQFDKKHEFKVDREEKSNLDSIIEQQENL